jgi:hypothetical protein
MKLAPVLLIFAIGAQASWFGNEAPAYQTWDSKQLTAWLKAHDVPLPAAMQPPTHTYLQELVKKHWATAQDTASETYDSASQYANDAYDYGQHVFEAGKEQSQFAFDRIVDSWDDSNLRQFLLDNGVVEPKGPREQLVQLAKQKYREHVRQMGSLSAYVAQTTQNVRCHSPRRRCHPSIVCSSYRGCRSDARRRSSVIGSTRPGMTLSSISSSSTRVS